MHKMTSIALAISLSAVSTFALADASQPKLVLQVTVDALRGDLPERFRTNMGEGGFTYLLDEGIHYTNAHYQHANTETIVGHVALATGAPPAVNGMVGNVWYDRGLGRSVYNIEDGDFSLLTSGAGVDQSVEIDDTQKAAQGDGRSPLNIHTSTISDEVVKASNGKARAYSVSFKDRGAVSLAGELGKAFWFSKATGGFVTSDYYFQDYPNWVLDWNDKGFLEQYSNQRWELMLDREKYLFAEEGDVSFKTELATFKRTFPYPYGPSSFKYFTTMLSLSPAGDEIVADFAKDLIAHEKLGQNDYTDYLAVSFSATDYVIHTSGPSSIEAEDNLLRLDRTLADLFDYVDEMVGLENTLIVLSSDHGAPDAPGFITNHGGSKAGYFGVAALEESGLFERTQEEFGVGKEVLQTYSDPYLYLNHEVLEKNKLNLAQVQSFIAKEVVKIAGVDQAFTSHDIESGTLMDTRIARLVSNNHFPSRSGDIYLVYNPNVYINDFDSLRVASVHGSPWRYDTHVPVIFAGLNIEGEKIHDKVTPYDIAPTISAVLGILPPSGSTGAVLTEVLD